MEIIGNTRGVQRNDSRAIKRGGKSTYFMYEGYRNYAQFRVTEKGREREKKKESVIARCRVNSNKLSKVNFPESYKARQGEIKKSQRS